MTVLRLNDVSLSFGVAPVLDCIDLTIERGERVCLVGRNGQGKSSLMKLIGGLLQSDSGTVQLGGSMRVAYLPQDVPSDVSGTITDVVGDAHREIFDLLTEYQSIADSLATDPDEKKFGDLERIQFELDERSGWDIQDRIANHLRRFKLDGNQRFETLSGGMKRRVLLARCLVSEPDLLMLDEPTNHLDIPSIAWLEACLQSFQGALLFVTHDRMFLRKIATRILDLDRGRLTSWPGDFDLYQKRKDVAMQAEENEWRRFDKKLAEEEAWIRQGIKARRTRNEGRVRALKRLRQDRQKRRERIGKLRLNIGDAAKSGKDVITAHDISFSWPDNRIVSHFSTRILRGDRIGIIGPNGCGKSTLLKLLLGELAPKDGQVELGTKLDLLYFDQLREQLDQNATVAENVSDGNDMVMVRGTPRHVVGYLRDFLFSPQRVRSPVHVLSGGEKNRLLLAKLFKKTANMIVLDEPTNDLDSESLELLESVLLQFAGTVLIVSHDREFLNNVVTSTIVFDDDGQIRNYAGGYDDWLQQRPQFDQSSSQPTEIKSSTEQPNEVQTKAAVRKLKYSERQELQALPGQIEVLEAEQTRVEAELSDPELYKSNDDQFSRLNVQLVEIQGRLAVHYDRWAELEEMDTETE